MTVRTSYLESLKTERAMLAGRQPSTAQQRRLTEVDAELDKYSDQPVEPQIEVAAPLGPISRSRTTRKS